MPVCHHITYAFGTERGDRLPPRPRALRIVGHADDGSGIEALIVAVDGTMVRPDGKIFHITLSHAEGRAPVESNALIARGLAQADADAGGGAAALERDARGRRRA